MSKLDDLLQKRRSYRALEKMEITREMIEKLASAAQSAPSCYNNQPWRYIFSYNEEVLENLKSAYSKGNKWAHNASLVITVFSQKELDCVVDNREYYLFDTGMATALLMTKATEMGLVTHAIAGFDPEKVKEILNIPENMEVITLIICGKHSIDLTMLNDRQKESEVKPADRKNFNEYSYIDIYK